ncbi:telomerase protein component 1-like isoform X1 [Asterias rubens]|uniref:telomerase protein component 1-like isoform X1 n=1 Tax=Asterias rubens TaxID=7604 RepID=UPI001455044A|nr:telomerase protein component 1-like isoform X1 [Asterias rubens]XP_033636002.1 telomerase protein component 1-like isoform X1 [Asterias rubens]XP_033636003.1 telomerase protein component 1-like isoform X1 [Asterias rubens]
MGCGASRSLDYSSDISQQWDSVQKTIEVKQQKKKLVIKRVGWKTVRIFVSSTFKDFHAEREVLIKEVFPDLRAWCEKRRLYLVDVDLRWGVPKDTTSEDTLRLCLGEIDRCYSDNIMPFFLNMTSERCGWVPGSMEVPENLHQEYRWINGLSVTEMEIMHGSYRKDNYNSIFAIRDASFLDSVPVKYHNDFVDSNPVAPHKLKMLKGMLSERFPINGSSPSSLLYTDSSLASMDNRVFTYKCSFGGISVDTGKVQMEGLDQFKKVIFEFFKTRIAEQYPLDANIKLDPYELQREAHDSFMKSRSVSVIGRNDVLQRMEDFLTGVSTGVPLLLLGGPGSGKSSIMAKVSDIAVSRAANGQIPGGGDKDWHVFYHFVGAIPGSTDVEKMLKRLLKEMKVCKDSNMPKDYETTAQLVGSTLSNPNSTPVIIFIDALNQLNEEKTTSILSWLPRKLAPQVRCIFSMIDETPPHRLLKDRNLKPEEEIVTPLDMDSRKEIVCDVLGRYNKRLDEEQMATLLGKESSQNPLWLAIACEELRVYGDFSTINSKITALSDGLLNLLSQVLGRFEKENGGYLVVATLSLLECSSNGLLETELLSILGDESNMAILKTGYASSENKKTTRGDPLPAIKWSMVYRALRPFLRPFGDSGEGRLDFYHRSLSKSVRQKYFGLQPGQESSLDNKMGKWWHTRLADFFEMEQNMDRKVEEYLYQLVKIGDQEKLARCLGEWPVLDRLFEADYSSQLLAYWRKCEESDGKYTKMEQCYKDSLKELEQRPGISQEEVSMRYETIARVFIQAGLYNESKDLIDVAVTLEQEHLGSRPERMVEHYALLAELWDELCKLHDFINPDQLNELRPAIDFGLKSIKIRETLDGDEHKYKMANSVMRLSFNLNNWAECGGDSNRSEQEAQDESFVQADEAIRLFKEIGDLGKEAEASMTKAIVFPRGDEEQIQWYELAREQCQQAYGENCKLMTRIMSNIGIYYEDKRDYQTAYTYFVKWHEVSTEVFGEQHPKTKSAFSCINEPRYLQIKERLSRQRQEQR